MNEQQAVDRLKRVKAGEPLTEVYGIKPNFADNHEGTPEAAARQQQVADWELLADAFVEEHGK